MPRRPVQEARLLAANRGIDETVDATTVGEGTMNQEINNGAVRVLRDYTGRGPTKARSVIDHDSVTILLRATR